MVDLPWFLVGACTVLDFRMSIVRFFVLLLQGGPWRGRFRFGLLTF